jgi:hypothetical protein
MSEKMKINVERKDLNIDFELEEIVKEMLKHKYKSFSDNRNYEITISKGKNVVMKELITAEISIKLIAPDTLIENIPKEEE